MLREERKELLFLWFKVFLILAVSSAILFWVCNFARSIFYKHTTVIPVLMYHHFDETEFNSVTVTKNKFKSQMEALRKEGYTAITQKQVEEFYYNHVPLPKKPILITIDDGYSSNYQIAYPILKKTGMKATIFSVTSQAGQTPGSLSHFSWRKAKLMSKSGVIEIQSHTDNLHHKEKRFFQSVPSLMYEFKGETKQEYLRRIDKDLTTSRKTIKENVGTSGRAISYPFGETNQKAIEVAKEAGFKLGYVIGGNLNTKYSDPYRLNRINVPGNWDAEELLKAITP